MMQNWDKENNQLVQSLMDDKLKKHKKGLIENCNANTQLLHLKKS